MAKTKRYDSQKRAEESYRERTDKEVLKYRRYKSNAKRFVETLAKQSDLIALKEMIEKRLK